MSRSGYDDDGDCWGWDLIRWRGAVASAIKGKRGQAFLLEMWRAMQALPEKKLIAGDLQTADGAVCAIGSVGRARGVDMSKIDPEDHYAIAKAFGIPHALACEIMYMNDEMYWVGDGSRFNHMQRWIEKELRPVPIEESTSPDKAGAT